jgi:serine/threonine protein kinase
MTGPGADARLGTTFAGYRIEAVLGVGGMGVVYRAFDPQLERQVALKVLPPALATDPEARARFLQEVRLAARIRNSHIVVVYASGEVDGQLYLVMDYIQGPELRTLIERDGPLGPARAAEIIGQIADALDEAHAAGLVHRDVKPANILVEPGPAPTDPGHAWLTDFGLARLASAGAGLTRPDLVVGTPGYVAPEQIEGGQIDHRVDIYALGCVLYHALSGTIPYPRDSTRSMLWAHLWEPPPRLAERTPALAPFDPVIGQALAKLPADRFQTARAFADAARRAALAVDPGRIIIGTSGEASEASAPPLIFERTASDLVRPGMPSVEPEPPPVPAPEPVPPPPTAEPVPPPPTRRQRVAAIPTDHADEPGVARTGSAGGDGGGHRRMRPPPWQTVTRRMNRQWVLASLAAIGGVVALMLVISAIVGLPGGAPSPSPTPGVTAAGLASGPLPTAVTPVRTTAFSTPQPPPPTLSPAEARAHLVALIPTGSGLIDCSDGSLQYTDAEASIGCLTNDLASVSYELFSSRELLDSDFDGWVSYYEVTPASGDCAGGQPGEGSWYRADGTLGGQVLCATDGTRYEVRWTDDLALVGGEYDQDDLGGDYPRPSLKTMYAKVIGGPYAVAGP